MTHTAPAAQAAANRAGIGLVLIAMLGVSVNDMAVKALSGGYPLHQLVFFRSSIGICVAAVFLHFEGGWSLLRTKRPFLHAVRALMIVGANMCFFAALAVMPLGLATGLFFAAPLFITILAALVLGEVVGPRRIGAILVGFLGVMLMTFEGVSLERLPLGVTLLPVLAAFFYAAMQTLTRKLGAESRASAMSIYIHVAFLTVSAGVFLVAGDGRFAEGQSSASLEFLLRAWRMPHEGDLWVLLGMGLLVGVIGYCLSQSYRLGEPAVIAPFEYVALPLAVFWGWLVFGELPTTRAVAGIVLIAGAGVYVHWREGRRGRAVTAEISKGGPARR